MKRKWIFTVLASFVLTGCAREAVTVAGMWSEDGEAVEYIEMQEFELKKQEESAGEKVRYCAVMIPAGYHESEDIQGMYVHERNPLDASNIYYTVSEGNEEGMVSGMLTKEVYQETMEKAYQEAGMEVALNIDSFEKIDMEGIPGYKIRSSYEVEDGEEIEQLVYLILAEDTYTITYSQMSDDELMADFEISDGEIRLVRDEKVSLAKDE
ncbi:MAG: hypothetical protein K2H52_02810 [Lachnospiraceae bacterium]|nr:hypothetical protein [Lachnospiraceae bacterium]MDE6185076.1 hypothetical protein [Lachnospiraceae bacterium]MDE7287059.1 hypothetical protein [Lachnospiraceae bacterium]